MAKSMDKVLQPDGSYKWELVEITTAYLEQKAANEAAFAAGLPFPGTEKPAEEAVKEEQPKTTRRKKATKVDESIEPAPEA
jgi:hypothetical protein